MVAVRFDSALYRRAMFAIACAAALLASGTSCAEEADLQLRLAWGGGEPVAWKGSISIGTDAPGVGAIERVAPIGLEPDSALSFLPDTDGVRIDCPTARTYEAVDLYIRAPVSANVVFSVSDGSSDPTVASIPISKLVAGQHTESIDKRGNQLTVERTPGDRLRVDIKREHLIFKPGEPWSVSVEPYVLGSSFPTSASLQTRLFKARSSEKLWADQQSLTIDGSGSVQGASAVTIPVPNEEGVYDLEFSIVRPRQRALIPTLSLIHI